MQMSSETTSAMEAIHPGVKPKVPQMLCSRQGHVGDTRIRVGDVTVGNGDFVVIAGPCSVESQEQMMTTAAAAKRAGAVMLRGGAFKPRTSPYSFQGLGEEGLILLSAAGRATGLPVVTEVMDSDDIPLVAAYADVIQIGARNIQNFSLLKKLGKANKPILMKRGLMTTIEEFLLSSEYILAAGNESVILCERGIRTFETATRNTLDLSAVPVLKERTHLPIIVDPSHAVGERRFVTPMAKAALAVGADGLMIETHIDPDKALCDGAQSLRPQEFSDLMACLRVLAPLFGRTMAEPEV